MLINRIDKWRQSLKLEYYTIVEEQSRANESHRHVAQFEKVANVHI